MLILHPFGQQIERNRAAIRARSACASALVPDLFALTLGMILLSLHQRKLVSNAANSLPPKARDQYIEQVARRLSQRRQYHDHDVARAVRPALRAVARTAMKMPVPGKTNDDAKSGRHPARLRKLPKDRKAAHVSRLFSPERALIAGLRDR
jgi:hypothetical protein